MILMELDMAVVFWKYTYIIDYIKGRERERVGIQESRESISMQG